jgi:hypothetical protein
MGGLERFEDVARVREKTSRRAGKAMSKARSGSTPPCPTLPAFKKDTYVSLPLKQNSPQALNANILSRS